MSDYFGALLRSSGLAGAPLAAAQPALREVDVEVPVPAVQPAVEAAAEENAAPPAALRPVARRVPASEPTEANEKPPAEVPARPARLPEPGAGCEAPAMTAQPSTGDALAASAEPPLSRLRSEASKAAAPPNSRVQAALRWVAADPQARSYAAGPTGFPSPRADSGASTSAAVEAVPTLPRSEPATFEHTAAIVARPEAALLRRPTPFRAADAAAPIEVSIGSIELRVEAPAAQTVARPAPSAPAAEFPSPPRSGLARRALRRI